MVLLVILNPQSSNAQVQVDETEKSTHSISCDIQTEGREWNRTAGATVLGKIENLTGGPLNVEVIPILYLSSKTSNEPSDRFWAPVDLFHDGPLATERRPLDAKGRAEAIRPRPIRLQFKSKGEIFNFRIEAGNALWAREISSVWPSLNLFSAVKSGVYELQMVLGTYDGIAKSKEVAIQIDVGRTEPR
jgi:hypothetical protein